MVVMQMVNRYTTFHFVWVKMTKSAKNIYILIIKKVIILGFLHVNTLLQNISQRQFLF